MQQPLFSTECTTCGARLGVRSEAAIGAILPCPKCGSMVQITPPPGYEPLGEAAAAAAVVGAAMPENYPEEGSGSADTPANSSPPPPAEPSPTEPTAAEPTPAETPPQPPPPPVQGYATYAAPIETLLRRWVPWAAGGLAAVVLILGAWAILTPEEDPAAELPEVAVVEEPSAKPQPEPETPPPPQEPEDGNLEAEGAFPSDPNDGATNSDDSTPGLGEADPAADASIADSAPAGHDAEATDDVPDGDGHASAADTAGVGGDGAAGNENSAQQSGQEMIGDAEGDIDPGASPASTPNVQMSVAAVGFEPRRVDVSARLTDPIGGIELVRLPLGAAVATLGRVSTIPVTFDPDALHQQRVALSDPVSVTLGPGSVADALAAVLSEAGLGYTIDAGHLIVTTPEPFRREQVRRRYTVADLAPDRKSLGELARLIKRFVEPASWQSGGGPGTIEPGDGALTITQTPAVHSEAIDFCERLRRARGMPLKSRLPIERFDLTPRHEQAAETLDRKLTVNFFEPVPLVDVLGYLGRTAGVDLLIDRHALAAEGLSDQIPVRLIATERPLREVLAGLLEPLGLGFRAIDRRTLQVTSRRELQTRLQREFYPVADLLEPENPAASAERLVRQLEAQLASAAAAGTIHFDPPSRSLIVLQSPLSHRALQRHLAELDKRSEE